MVIPAHPFANIQKISFPPNKLDEKYHKSIKKHKHSPTLINKSIAPTDI